MALNNIEELVAALVASVQELEAVVFDLLTETHLDTAIGVQLDVIGRIVGRTRQGEADEAYRERLRAQIAINLSSGTKEQVIDVVRRSIDGSPAVELVQGTIAEFTIDVLASITAAAALRAAQSLKRAKVGGVKANLDFFDATPVFAYDGFGGAKFDGGFFYASSIDAGST